MKRVLPLLLGVAFMVLTMAACEGDEGPVGPQGPPGEPGEPGQNALNTCVDCHNNDTELLAIELQYAQSGHFNNVYWERTGSSCMECHNHNGFITAVVNGEELPSSFDNPVPINCRTCHQIHSEFTEDDYALTTADAVDLIMGDIFDLGNGNLCANCHQSRSFTVPVIGGDQILLNPQGGVSPPGNRFGPHYAPQANVMMASGLLEIPGSIDYPTNTGHQIACVDCHMASPEFDTRAGYVAGGHQFGLNWGEGEDAEDGDFQLVAACTDCHSTSDFDLAGFRSDTQELLATLRELLEGPAGLGSPNYSDDPEYVPLSIMRPEDYYANPGLYDPEVAMAFLNWKFIYHDGSYGSHHPRYAKAILENSIEAMEARLPPP